ncbi:hypothetical protein BC834DRAFT_103839 [Gloeopeniophorella convolvens]|nr:hypothetical protein BC834DRAFT_103839 [Gloeopeniophorella convolvens]
MPRACRVSGPHRVWRDIKLKDQSARGRRSRFYLLRPPLALSRRSSHYQAMHHRQHHPTSTSENNTQVAAVVPYHTYPSLPPMAAPTYQAACTTTRRLDNHHPSQPTSCVSTTMYPYHPYSYPHSPLPHATSISLFNPSPPPPNPALHVAAQLPPNHYSPQALPASRPSYNSLSLPTLHAQFGAGLPLSIEHVPDLHPTLEEFDLYVRHYMGLAHSMIPLKLACVASGSRPVKRLRTHGPFPDQSHPVRRTSISSLNHDVLLEIFDWYFIRREMRYPPVLWFRAIIHVCRRWRHLILRFTQRFNLEIHCTNRTPVADLLTHFASLPIKFEFRGSDGTLTAEDEDNLLKAMEQSRRLRHVGVHAPYHTIQQAFAAMDGHLPLLEVLLCRVVPDHLDGRPPTESTSQARTFIFPSLSSTPRPTRHQSEKVAPLIKPPKLSHLPALEVLSLHDIPSAAFLPPEFLVKLLLATPLLNFLDIGFRFPGLYRDTATTTIPASTRCTSLPHLRSFRFKGAREYFENLVSRINAPSLEGSGVQFFNQPPLPLPNLEWPSCRLWQSLFSKGTQITVSFGWDTVYACHGLNPGCANWLWRILSSQFDWQVASAAECFQSLALALLKVDNLQLQFHTDSMPPEWQDVSEPEDWCNLLKPFGNVKTLQVHPALCRDVSRSLMSNGAQVSLDLLPELQTLELRKDDDDGRMAFADFLVGRECEKRPVSIQYIDSLW